MGTEEEKKRKEEFNGTGPVTCGTIMLVRKFCRQAHTIEKELTISSKQRNVKEKQTERKTKRTTLLDLIN